MLDVDGTELKNDSGSKSSIIDGTDASFAKDVLEASNETPIIVDFWAPWCGPCKQLTPLLEEQITNAKGRVRLVKINIDQNQQVAAQLRVQSIPMVFAFADGKPVDGFAGAKTANEIKQFVDKIAGNYGKGADETELLENAEAMLAQGAVGEAAEIFAGFAKNGSLRGVAGLVKCYIAGGDLERAEQTLSFVDEKKQSDEFINSARSALDIALQARKSAGKLDKFKEAVAANENDHKARFDLAMALINTGKHAEAIDMLLEILRRDQEWKDGEAKSQLLKLFDALGAKNPIVLAGRRKLSSVLFS